MSKIVAEEFDVCHKFVDEEIKYFLPIEKRKSVEISHVVGCSDFVIFISYDKKNFSAVIKNFVSKIINEAKKSDVATYRWRFRRPLVEERKNLDFYILIDRIDIIFTAE